jgi:hypothetical protein
MENTELITIGCLGVGIIGLLLQAPQTYHSITQIREKRQLQSPEERDTMSVTCKMKVVGQIIFTIISLVLIVLGTAILVRRPGAAVPAVATAAPPNNQKQSSPPAPSPASPLGAPSHTHKLKPPLPTQPSPPQQGSQSVGKVDCSSNNGNCAGINNGQQIFNLNGEPPSIKQLVVEVKTTCTLKDAKKVPQEIVMSVPSENSYIGGGTGKEILIDGAYSFEPAALNGMLIANQKFSLEPTSSLIGSPTELLFRNYSLLHIVNTAVSGGYFTECTFLSIDMKVNGTGVLRTEAPVLLQLDGLNGVSFDIRLAQGFMR